MIGEARLEEAGSGLVPVGRGWFVVNAADAAWVTHDAFGARCSFEASPPAVRDRPELDGLRFADVGCTLAVLEPGRPSGLYHAENVEEDFLVLAGECLALVEDAERPLRAWDFLHCPAGTAHCFVGAGDGPCALLMLGARTAERRPTYPRSDTARAHGAGVAAATDSPREAYAPFGHWGPGPRAGGPGVPWA